MHDVGALSGVTAFPPFIHSFNKYWLRIHEAPGPGLGAGDTAVHETEALPSRGLLSGGLGGSEVWGFHIQSTSAQATEPTHTY